MQPDARGRTGTRRAMCVVAGRDGTEPAPLIDNRRSGDGWASGFTVKQEHDHNLPNGEQDMRTQEYILQGKDVPAKFRGTKVNLRIAETSEDMARLSENPTGLFNDAYVIYQQGVMRRLSAKEDATTESLAKAAGEIVHRKTTPGTPKTAKPQTKVKAAAAGTGNRIFERELAEPGYIDRGIAAGVFDAQTKAEFAEWRQNRIAAAEAKAAAPAASGNGQAATTQAPAAQQPNVARRPAGAGGGKK